MDMSFREFLVLDPLVLEGMLVLSRIYREATKQPFLLPQNQGFPLAYPGKHLQVVPNPNPGKPTLIHRPDSTAGAKVQIASGGNFILKLDDLKRVPGMANAEVPDVLSHFVRDQPYVAAFSQGSPENMAATIIFVLMTIRSDFMGVMQDFPVVMMELMTAFNDGIPDDPDAAGDMLKAQLFQLQGDMARMTKGAPKNIKKNSKGFPYRVGFGLGGSVFGWKYKGIAQVWKDREKHYDILMSLVSAKNTVTCFEYLYNNITGLGMAKAGFCVQLIFGELGCIDMHNINLYSQYYLDRQGQARRRTQQMQPDHLKGQTISMPSNKRDVKMYSLMDPKVGGWGSTDKGEPLPNEPLIKQGLGQPSGLSPKMQASFDRRYVTFSGKLEKYLEALRELERDGFTTVKLWDIWVAYVSRSYINKDGTSRYARDGRFAGNPLDPVNDPTDKKIMATRAPIPDRNTIRTSDSADWRQTDDGSWEPVKKSKSGKINPLTTYTVDDMDKERSAGSASLAHGATWWWRQPDYWWDMLKQAEAVVKKMRRRPDDIFRFASADATSWEDKDSKAYEQPSAEIAKPLAYLATRPKLLRKVFDNDEERKEFANRLKEVIGKLEFWNPD